MLSARVRHSEDDFRGVDRFLQRLKQAQQLKMEAAEAFLLPSQKKKGGERQKLASPGKSRAYETYQTELMGEEDFRGD